MTAFAEISPSQLSRLIGLPDCPAIIDLRIDEDFDADPQVLPGAVRFPHTDLAAITAYLEGRRSVVYCQKGRKISQGVAALLRTEGLECQVLEGGHFAWRDAGLPMVPANAIPRTADQQHTLWVTRHRPKIDRIACPWLIRRFIDPKAEVLFVPPRDVLDVAERCDATAFDAPGAPYTDTKDRCTFDALLDAFSLRTQALDDLSRVIRAADRGALSEAPQAAGLLAASVGFSKIHRDDHAQLAAMMPLYDALYRWARDGQAETHGHDEVDQ